MKKYKKRFLTLILTPKSKVKLFRNVAEFFFYEMAEESPQDLATMVEALESNLEEAHEEDEEEVDWGPEVDPLQVAHHLVAVLQSRPLQNLIIF